MSTKQKLAKDRLVKTKPEGDNETITVPDWDTRLRTLKIIFSLIPEHRRLRILNSMKLSDEEIRVKLSEAMSKVDKDGLRWGAKKKRFFILQRDSFACQYCGAKAPDAKLEIDHILPIARGGDSSTDNLITACKECNIGKGAYEF